MNINADIKILANHIQQYIKKNHTLCSNGIYPWVQVWLYICINVMDANIPSTNKMEGKNNLFGTSRVLQSGAQVCPPAWELRSHIPRGGQSPSHVV